MEPVTPVETVIHVDPVTPVEPVIPVEHVEPVAPQVAVLPQRVYMDDVNVIKDGENAEDYESIGSEDDGSSDDDVVERPQLGEPVSSDEDELELIDAAFIDRLGNSLSVENMDTAALQSMAWTPASTDFEDDTPAFPGLREQVARPNDDSCQEGFPVGVTVLFYADVPVEVYRARD